MVGVCGCGFLFSCFLWNLEFSSGIYHRAMQLQQSILPRPPGGSPKGGARINLHRLSDTPVGLPNQGGGAGSTRAVNTDAWTVDKVKKRGGG